MEIKEMPIEEKYDRILDMYMLWNAANYAFSKEQGTLNKWLDYTLEVYRGYMGPMLELMKTLVPGKIFKHAVNQLTYMQQIYQPLSELELSWVSDREAVLRIKNCERLRRRRKMVKRAGLNINPREVCKMDITTHMSLTKWFGIDIHVKLEENGCKWTVKLK